MRILVVDDDPGIRDALVDILSGEGHEVEVAHNGWVALQLLLHRPAPALVLLDLRMPEMSGEELLALMRKHPHLARLPVVIMTGEEWYGSAAQRSVGLLAKPFDLDALLDVVGRALGAPAETAAVVH